MSDGIFGTYDDYVQDQESGLYSEEGLGDSEDPPFVDCDLTAVVQVLEMSAWISENEKNKGNRYFAAELKVIDIWSQSVPDEAPHEKSEIVEGGKMTHLNKLSKYDDPDLMDYGEQKSLDEAISLGSALVELKKPFFAPHNLDQMCEDDGQRVKGRFVGIDVEHEVSEQEFQGGQTVTRVFFNSEFFPVEQQPPHDRKPRKTPDEIQNNAAE